jgi:hypothetical protein
MAQVTINQDQRLYVIPAGQGGYSCLGFDVARDNANHMLATMLGSAGVSPTAHALYVEESERGSMGAYEKYLGVHDLWRDSRASKTTYFAPGTPELVRKVLERYRKDGERELRLWYGDASSGRDWCEEHDVVGHIGRSCGYVKVPLLVPEGECGGTAILTHCIVRLMDVASGRELYRAENYQPPQLVVCADQRDGRLPWCVERDGQEQARFAAEADAHAYIAYMHGATRKPYYLLG